MATFSLLNVTQSTSQNDSKIFELQSSLLEEGVTEALLRECTVWFRPKHLEDIIIERSEAEGMCGWPGCRNLLPSWGLRARRVFNMLDEEVAGRFCTRACMAVSVYPPAIPASHVFFSSYLFSGQVHINSIVEIKGGALRSAA